MRTLHLVCPAALLALAACGPAATTGDDTGDDAPPDAAPTDACAPDEVRACYTGPAGTQGVGACAGGTQACTAGGTWGACVGQVTPAADACGDGVDQDCDGTADNPVDQDGDGYTTCAGDCCDSSADGCLSPEKVGPGAIEVAGNMLDDDCDGTVDNPVEALCDTGLASNSSTAMDYARAMDLCQAASMTGPGWGVIAARFVKADGTGAPAADQRSIRPAFGATAVQKGQSMVVISTGVAAATGQTSPNAAFGWEGVDSTEHASGSQFPADWLSANGGQLPNAPGCPAPSTPPIPLPGLFPANDPVMLELTIRTPQNAASFRLRTNFMSSEFPEYVCTEFNDFFVVLLDSAWSGAPANPADKNLAFYVNGTGSRYPVGVNLAYGDTGLFTVCRNGETGCSGFDPGTINTCVSDAELVGTGMELDTADGASCSLVQTDDVGGGTGWLVTSGNVNGNEVIKLRIALWDTGDGGWDSVAMIDGFEWSLSPSEPGTVIDVD